MQLLYSIQHHGPHHCTATFVQFIWSECCELHCIVMVLHLCVWMLTKHLLSRREIKDIRQDTKYMM